MPSKLSVVPEPLHLKDCASVVADSDLPSSPQHPVLTSRAVDKVNWWIEKIDGKTESLPSMVPVPNANKISKSNPLNKLAEPELSTSMKNKQKLLSSVKTPKKGSVSSKSRIGHMESMATATIIKKKEDAGSTQQFSFPAVDKRFSSDQEVHDDIKTPQAQIIEV